MGRGAWQAIYSPWGLKSQTRVCVCSVTFFHVLFHYSLSQDIEYSSPCYTVGPCCLSILKVSDHNDFSIWLTTIHGPEHLINQ